MDITILTDNAQRASFMFDNAGRDIDTVLAEIAQGVDDYVAAHGNDDKLPDTLCGAVCATVAAANLYGAATVPMGIGDFLAVMGEAHWHAAHATDHNDPMADAFFPHRNEPADADDEGETVHDVVARIGEWVLSNLPESDPDAFLASVILESAFAEGDDA